MAIYQGDKKVSGGVNKSPYQYALEHGYSGSETEFYAHLATKHTYGTEDLEAGVSTLATGQIYFVYE